MALSYSSEPARVFFSLAPVDPDRQLFKQLRTHLSMQKRQGLIEIHYDDDVLPGGDYREIIHSYIRMADIIVLLLSADFFDSDECVQRDLLWAFEEHDTRAIPLIPVLLRPAEWEGFHLERYSPLPPNREPVSSWKDHDMAFTAVAQGIRQAITELKGRLTGTSPKRTPSPFPLYLLQHRPNPFFTDREATLREIRRAFTSSQETYTYIQALYGLGGIGKSAIASAYAYHYHKEYQEAIIWLNALTPELFLSSLPNLAARLGIAPPATIDENTYAILIQQWLQQHNHWLVIIDNLEDFTILDQLIPAYSNGHVLVTTRIRATQPFTSILEVEPLSEEDGALLLLRRANIVPTEEHREQARIIAREVASYPLALDQAGAYIEETHLTLTSYLARYLGQQTALLQKRGSAFPYEHPDPVTTTLALTFQKVEQINPTAHALLRLCAFLHPDALPNEVLTSGASSLQGPLRALSNPLILDDALATLLRFSLIHQSPESTMLNLPPIVQTVLRAELPMQEKSEWASEAVRLINAIFPEVSFKTWHACERYATQAQHCATLIRDFQLSLKEGGVLLERLGFYAYQRGFYMQADTYLTQALLLQETYHKEEVSDIARTLNEQGLVAQRRARYQDAKTLFERALVLQEKASGSYEAATAEILHNLAAWYEEDGQLDQAAQLYERALIADERHGKASLLDIGQTWNNLAVVRYRQGQPDQAEEAYQHALTAYQRASSAQHPNVSYILTGQGVLAEKRHDYQRATELYQQALTIRQQTLGEKHSETAYSFNRLAHIMRLQGDYQQATILYQQALAIAEEVLEAPHPAVAFILNNLGLLALTEREYQRAAAFFERVLTIYEQIPDPDSRAIEHVLTNLEQLISQAAESTQARVLLQRAQAASTRIHPPSQTDQNSRRES